MSFTLNTQLDRIEFLLAQLSDRFTVLEAKIDKLVEVVVDNNDHLLMAADEKEEVK